VPESLNLLPEKKPEQYPLPQKFYYWTINIGRAIIVLTELVVLGVFLARFKIDRDLNDLSESIEIKQGVYQSYSNLEPRFRLVQERLAAVKGVTDRQLSFSQALTDIAQAAPSGLALVKLDLNAQEIFLRANAASPLDFADFISSLTASRKVKAIILTNCNYNGGEGLFYIAVKITPQPEFFAGVLP